MPCVSWPCLVCTVSLACQYVCLAARIFIRGEKEKYKSEMSNGGVGGFSAGIKGSNRKNSDFFNFFWLKWSTSVALVLIFVKIKVFISFGFQNKGVFFVY